MSDSMRKINTKNIISMTQYGAALTGELEEVLLHDTNSKLYKEHLSMLMNEINEEIDLENLQLLMQHENQLIEKYKEQELAEKKARDEEKDKRHQQVQDDHEKMQQQLTPTKIIHPNIHVLKTLAGFIQLNLQITQTQQALQQVQANQQNIQNQWQAQQQQQAAQFIQAVNGMPILLPNGRALPANIVLQFDTNSTEAVELQQRLEAAPMLPDLLNTLEKSDMRDMYDKQVALHARNILKLHPDLDKDDQSVELAARQQAVHDLKLDLRQLQNKFLLSVTAIHGYMKRQGSHVIDNLVAEYNNALGIDVNKTPHKKIHIFKILDHTISPFLAPKLTMKNNKRNRDELDNNPHDLETQAMKESIQENRLRQQNVSQLSMLRALVASLRHVASENAEFSFLHDICDRVAAHVPTTPTRKNNLRLVPKGYNLK